MSSKDEILARIKTHTKARYDMPDLSLDAIQYTDKVSQFIDMMKFVGGEAIELQADDHLHRQIKALYPEAGTIASNIPGLLLTTIDPDKVETPYELNGTDLAIIEGEIGVAENGCVWIPQNVKEKAVYFIAEYLIILLEKKKLVNNMHEAYRQIQLNDYGFGVFISGPSKTADIEQSLVVGAHGARGVTVILK